MNDAALKQKERVQIESETPGMVRFGSSSKRQYGNQG
jgi:hypothetical protein